MLARVPQKLFAAEYAVELQQLLAAESAEDAEKLQQVLALECGEDTEFTERRRTRRLSSRSFELQRATSPDDFLGEAARDANTRLPSGFPKKNPARCERDHDSRAESSVFLSASVSSVSSASNAVSIFPRTPRIPRRTAVQLLRAFRVLRGNKAVPNANRHYGVDTTADFPMRIACNLVRSA
jgi:hypothetical protein